MHLWKVRQCTTVYYWVRLWLQWSCSSRHTKLSCLPSSESDDDDHFCNVLMWNHHITPHKHRSSFLRCIQRKKRHLHQIIIWSENHVLVRCQQGHWHLSTSRMERTDRSHQTRVVIVGLQPIEQNGIQNLESFAGHLWVLYFDIM